MSAGTKFDIANDDNSQLMCYDPPTPSPSSFEEEFGLDAHMIAGEERAWQSDLLLDLLVAWHLEHL